MIGFVDTITLARTKLRAQKLRLVVTVVVSALIFGLIIGGMSVIGGINKSLEDYSQEQFDGKYFVNTFLVNQLPEEMALGNDRTNPAVIKEVERLQKAYIAERQAAAKRLGIEYDPATEEAATTVDPFADPNLPKDQQVVLNMNSVGYMRYNDEKYAKLLSENPPKSYEDMLRTTTASNKPVKITKFTYARNLSMVFMKDGKEPNPEESPEPQSPNMGLFNVGIEMDDLEYYQMDESVLKTFELPADHERRMANKTAIPIMLPLDVAVKQFGGQVGLAERPKDAEQLIDWVQSAREKLNGQTYSLCYRNPASAQLIQQARAQQQEIAQNKNTAGYQMPDILYTLPSEDSCGPVTVTNKQTAAARQLTAKHEQFERETNPDYAEPAQSKVTFVLSGLLPETTHQSGAGMSLESFVKSLFGTTPFPGGAISKQSYDALPAEHQYRSLLFPEATTNEERYLATSGETYLLEYNSVADARRLILEKSCDEMAMFTEGCPEDKPFGLHAYGTNYVAISELMQVVRPMLLWFLIVVGSIAAIIIMAMMGRVMAESRRETAVFRAIGARRSDIVRVYMLYAVAIALRIILFAALLGLAFVLMVELLYARRASLYAEVAYGVFDSNAQFHFIGWSPYIALVVGAIIVVGLVGVIPPLIRNVRRNPINDMRDE